MSSNARPWLIGCGIGCAGLVLAAVAVGAGGFFFLRSSMSGFEKAVETRAQLEQRFGSADSFEPWAEGRIPSGRMEAFIAVREATQPARKEVSASFEALPIRAGEAEELEAKPFFEKMAAVLSIARTGMGMGAAIGGLFEARNQALLDAEMGMGEYTLIYVLAYHSWLKHPPDDGPGKQSDRVRFESRRFDMRVRRRLLNMFDNWANQPGPEPWRAALERELEALKKDAARVPFQDGLPEGLTQSLQPYRDRLEATYSPVTNEFELALNQKQGRWGIRTE